MPYRHRRRSILLFAILLLPLPALAFDFLGSFDAATPVKAAHTQPKPTPRVSTNGQVDRILIKKEERRLYLMRGDAPFRSYKVALGYQPSGHKQRKGDGRTPEGIYYLDWRSDRSNYRKALHVSYPNAQDRLRALRKGDDPGGLIMIHGQPARRGENRTGDWTFGCIAVSNLAIDEIWSYTSVGTPIEILP